MSYAWWLHNLKQVKFKQTQVGITACLNLVSTKYESNQP